MSRSKHDPSDTPARADEVAAEWVAITSLKPWKRNPRENAAAIQPVADSIKRFGFGATIVARREDGEIIAGHTRYEAAKRLGLDRVPVRFLDLDPADARLLALADNRLGEIATWDERGLLALLGDLRQSGTDSAAVAGWTDESIDDLLARAVDAIAGAEILGDEAFDSLPTSGEPEVQTMSFLLTLSERETVRSALARAGESSSGSSLAAVCRAYLGG